MTEDAIRSLQRELSAFAAERGWECYHTPRNLAALISTEAGELLALFRWDQDSLAERPHAVRHELADVFLGVLRFADVAGIDIAAAAREKIDINRGNYPLGSTSPDRGG
ncbi:nucleotide pyrophosphohydrolase [Longimicrobium sp.]|uniref:nucleotide pyrophosphohydrolase n=1 Tax=Longimicrobium sp. TaxID=2029185 RepID=UPI0032C23538